MKWISVKDKTPSSFYDNHILFVRGVVNIQHRENENIKSTKQVMAIVKWKDFEIIWQELLDPGSLKNQVGFHVGALDALKEGFNVEELNRESVSAWGNIPEFIKEIVHLHPDWNTFCNCNDEDWDS
jgi:hypothetical protein